MESTSEKLTSMMLENRSISAGAESRGDVAYSVIPSLGASKPIENNLTGSLNGMWR